MTVIRLQLFEAEKVRRTLIRAVIAGEIPVADAARQLGITTQRLNALRRRYEAHGDAAFVDRRRSGRSKHMPIEVRNAIIAIVRSHYLGRACIDIKRALAQHHAIEIENYTLRRLLIAEGLIKVRSRVIRSRQPAHPAGLRQLRFRYRAVRLRSWLSQVQVAVPQPWQPSPALMTALASLSDAAAALIHQAKHELSAHDFLAAFDPNRMSYDEFARRFPAATPPRRTQH